MFAARLPKDLPAYLAGVFLEPAMHVAIEEDLVRRMNYLKYKAAVAIEKIEPRAAKPGEIAAAEALLAQASAIKNQLVQANLRVAIHVARKHQRPVAGRQSQSRARGRCFERHHPALERLSQSSNRVGPMRGLAPSGVRPRASRAAPK